MSTRVLAKAKALCYHVARYAPVGVLSAPGLRPGAIPRKGGDRQVRNYELLFIIHPDVDEDNLTAIVERVTDLIARNDGEVKNVEAWGMRRLAYPIQDQREGQYVLMKLEMQPQGVAGLENDLHLLEAIMRHIVVRLEP
ncbi:MAG TPA: 30S ribosomal protein S6 [Chloroflexi bacterium]|nr:30S ribosomal protein S6 [Chloroflexota bacterium]